MKSSHFRAAEALLERGANVNVQDSHGMTALHYMLKKDSDKIIEKPDQTTILRTVSLVLLRPSVVVFTFAA